ncbi:nuclear pore membrane glycoprotein 210 isoform X2 [Maniola jurtina]|uniref:nuclear pore membrane glycoprotein 210 isoform X2 n=1 Tax=Maniola jurtina TaxID=191418 RepID=UPI001E6867CD|nr:nuclear pore membrane glycoprotein 210 isoform X2 [Maniola jurtina]
MRYLGQVFVAFIALHFCIITCDCAKINTPRVLLPWFENLNVNFTFEIIEGGCYSWSSSRDDIIDLEALYGDTWGHCSRAARVSVSKTCVPPGSVIIFAEEVSTGEVLRGDVDIDKISSLKIVGTTWKLYLEEAPEAFEVVANDDQGNTFSTLEGVSFTWTIENVGSTYGEDPLVTLVRWSDTDYEAPKGVAELEARGLRSHSVLLYGQAMGESKVTVCLEKICTSFNLQVVASVVLTPAVAYVAPGDTLRYKVVRVRAGRLTIQDVAETLYTMKVDNTGVATLEDTISLVRGTHIGTSHLFLMSGITEVSKATLTVVEPHSIRVIIRPSNLIVYGELFNIHCVVYDEAGHALTAGQEMLIRLTVNGDANVDLLMSNENGTITEAVAQNAGEFTVTAILYSIAGRALMRKIEGQESAVVIEPLEVVPPELYVAWTDTTQDIQLQHRGGGEEPVTWSESELGHNALSLAPTGILTVRDVGQLEVRVHLPRYPHIRAVGRVWSAVPDLIQVSSSGFARVGRPHQLHVALTATNPSTGELYNFHSCNCGSFTVSLLEGPEPQNVTAAPWLQPMDGACCVIQCFWSTRGISTIRVSRGRMGDTARIAVRAAPTLLWPQQAAALVGASLPVIAEGEALEPQSSEPRVADLTNRDGLPPYRYPDAQLFTLKCRRKGDARVEVVSFTDEERESVELEVSCAPHVSRIRLEPPDTPGNCSGGPRLWLRPNQEVSVKVSLLDAIGRELLDEEGPSVSWEVQPYHVGIEYRSTDRLFVETNPEFAKVPVPDKYFQLLAATENAIGWSGSLKASIPDATASIQAKVVAPLKCDPLKVNIAWEGETVSNIATITGGSGKYSVDTPKGVTASIEGGSVTALVPAPGNYDLVVADLCVYGEKQVVEVNIEEVLSVEVATARAVCVGGCIPITALVKGISHRYLSTSREPDWKTLGDITVKNGSLCGLKEGFGRVRAALGGVWSPEVEVTVFPALRIVPERSRLPAGGRVQLRHVGGPPSHLAALSYHATHGQTHLQVSPSGLVQGVSTGKARVKLVASDFGNVELASAEAEIEVVPISNLRVKAATQTLLVGRPGPVWIEAAGLTATALSSLQPAPRVTWSLRDPTTARLYNTHADDQLERSVVEGLSVRVVPLKPGVITLDVRVRNMGQVAETRSWDSTIEILGISDIRTSIDGLSRELNTGDRLSMAVGATVRLVSLPRGSWSAYEDGSCEVRSNGDVAATRPGHGVILAKHRDDRNDIDRLSVIHVEVSTPHYCTAEPSGETEESSVRIVLRNSLGRELLAPQANVSLGPPFAAHVRRAADSVLGDELLIAGLDASEAFLSFQSTIGGTTVSDEVWVTGSDSYANRVIATGSWAICIDGVGWRAPPSIQLFPGAGVTLAILSQDTSARHVLRLDRPAATYIIHQLPVQKMVFVPGEWPFALVPLSIEGSGLTTSPLVCTEEQKYALEDVEVELPYSCRTKAPHTAKPVLDIYSGQLGCTIIPATQIKEASEVELCAEWGVARTCTKVLLLPLIQVSSTKLSINNPPTSFTITGHPHALKVVKITSSPGLKLEINTKDGEINVLINSEVTTCGFGWVNVVSKLTSQDIRIEVERECEVGCGTLLGAIFSLVRPFLPTLVTIVALVAGYTYVQSRLEQKGKIMLPKEPAQTVLSPTPPLRNRTWSRSPYAAAGPAAPVYGDSSMLPDASFSPDSTRIHSRFL